MIHVNSMVVSTMIDDGYVHAHVSMTDQVFQDVMTTLPAYVNKQFKVRKEIKQNTIL